MKIWTVIGRTESGDGVGPYVFDTEPSTEEIETILKKDWSEEIGENGDLYVNYFLVPGELIQKFPLKL